MYALRQVLAPILLALACTANAETITGLVVSVADGDTITVLDADKVQHKIRLAGIDQLDSTIGNRVAFAQALTDGISVYDLADNQAKAEIDFVIQELERAKWV